MAKLATVTSYKTYKTVENLQRAVDAVAHIKDAKYVISVNADGRFYPVFIWSEKCDWQASVVAHYGWCVISA